MGYDAQRRLKERHYRFVYRGHKVPATSGSARRKPRGVAETFHDYHRLCLTLRRLYLTLERLYLTLKRLYLTLERLYLTLNRLYLILLAVSDLTL